SASGQERANGKSSGAVPEHVEEFFRLLHGGTDQQQVHVTEVRFFRRIEILVADIASAYNGKSAIRNPCLVVHAPCRAHGSQEKFDAAPQHVAARAGRIEQSKLDVGMLVDGAIDRIATQRIHVVEQNTDPYAAVSSGQHLVE